MAAILSSQQTYLLAVIPQVEYTRKKNSALPIFQAFDQRSSSNIDGYISISKFDLLCDLVTTSMTLWIRIYTHVVIISWYVCTENLTMIYLFVLVIMKSVISLIKEHTAPILRSPCDVIDDVIIIKNYTFGIILEDLFVSEIEAVFHISKFSKWPPFWVHD